ncbi:uncharacterized protein K452DRAFT_297791 [Aplosporella prunicola CBS 121167]|uniref:Uncharacterized protein n=1 Tax=Aplosporella prunicola CBS 121167 TaxID=1176127 RepID=A0A6A6BGI4_9PEZI|nr:uncharacterized protein K452DRAFT_297791 [Aplosporella prunicola CBS 121167]KAF2142523.1 hypothetical protein K452DRAFT_297791 [Aplosporella prunicola CBS 121167]
MQSMFRLPWSTENAVLDKAQYSQKPRPVVEIPLLSKLKRKRTDSPEPSPPYGQHFPKKWKYAHDGVRPVVEIGKPDRLAEQDAPSPAPARVKSAAKVSDAPLLPKAEPTPSPIEQAQLSPTALPSPTSATMDASLEASLDASMVDADPTAFTPLQQAIETHFDQEILLKHNELRLIEQELAKCQVALEQLRRCHVIPYPGTDAASTDVSRGVGASLEPRQGYTAPESPAPWGVTDGPYSRHYAKWLIPDPKFDSVPVASLQSSRSSSGPSEGRATRGSLAELPVAGKSRSSRASAGSKLQALGDPSAPKIDPLLHRRSTDGKWVRLFCHHPDCRHSNFSNTQGFLNHCRIKHNQKFESHDQAAVECGVPVDVNELGVVVPNNNEPAPQTPAAATHPNGPFVHPLIRSNPPTKPADVLARRIPPRKKSQAAPPDSCDAAQTPQPKAKQNSSFVPSPQTPYMSALLQKQGFDGDLNQLVDFARTKVDLAELDASESSDDEPAQSAKTAPKSKKKSSANANASRAPVPSRLPARAGVAPAPLATTNLHPTGHAAPPSLGHSDSATSNGSLRGGNAESPTMELSPHALDSAPGLVTDHEDDDDEEDDQGSVNMHTEGESFGVDDVVVEDGSDVERDGGCRREKSVEGFGMAKAGPSKK